MAKSNTAGIGFEAVTPSGIQNIDGILNAFKWDSLNLTYSFPTASSAYGTPPDTKDASGNLLSSNYPYKDPFNGFSTLNPQQQAEVVRAFKLVESYTKLTFTAINETNTIHA